MAERDKDDKGKPPRGVVRSSPVVGQNARRVTRSSGKSGKFKDIQSYKRAHSADVRKKSKRKRKRR